MTINIPNDRSIAPSTSPDTVGISRAALGSFKGNGVGSGDNIAVSSGTMTIHSALEDVAAARASRVASLAQLYSTGRYAPESAATAKSMINVDDSVKV